jgi:tRNA (mo5U34)-methyltransferase
MKPMPSSLEYLAQLPASARRQEIAAIHQERQQWVNQPKKGFLRYRNPYETLTNFPARSVDCTGDTVIIGKPDELSEGDQDQIKAALRAFMPWRKGPFSVFGIDIDAEWRSERKWQRLLPMLPNLEGKIIADIGCNNGYYMFRMAPYRPKLVLGLEPSMQHYYCFKALNSMARQEALHIDLLGVEHLSLFPDCFDVLFLMGIIYHRASPIDVLRDCYQALRPGGTLMLESQAIPGDAPIALFPDKTYAKVPGTYFVPTGHCLRLWMEKAGFDQVELFCQHPMSEEEQRATEWMTFESYRNFIDPQDPTLTMEGYPAPLRVFLRGWKK